MELGIDQKGGIMNLFPCKNRRSFPGIEPGTKIKKVATLLGGLALPSPSEIRKYLQGEHQRVDEPWN